MPWSIASTRASVGGTIGSPSVHPWLRKWASTASSESGSSRTSDVRTGAGRATSLPCGRPRAEARQELARGARRPRLDPLDWLTAERMVDDQEREILHPERVGLVVRECLEGRRR